MLAPSFCTGSLKMFKRLPYLKSCIPSVPHAALPRYHDETQAWLVESCAKVERVSICLSVEGHSGTQVSSLSLSLKYGWLLCPALPLRTEASKGARICAPRWHFRTGCCPQQQRGKEWDGGKGLLLFTTSSSYNCRGARSKPDSV